MAVVSDELRVELAEIRRAIAQILAHLTEIAAAQNQKIKPLLTSEEIADLVGVTAYTVRRWIRKKQLPAERVAGTGPRGRYLIRREALEALLATGLGGKLDPREIPEL